MKLRIHDVPIDDRTSDWMVMAVFKRRIRQMEEILGPVLQAQMKKRLLNSF